MDYFAWTERARSFIDRVRRHHPDSRVWIEPPATSEQVATVEESIGQTLSTQLRNFLLTASGDCTFCYFANPATEAETQRLRAELGSDCVCGGLAYFAAWNLLARDYEDAREFAALGVYGDAAFCQDPLPIGSMDNGHLMALDLSSEAVVFLTFDQPPRIVAPDFDAFLTRWEAIYYLDFDVNERFIDSEEGGIDPTLDRPVLQRIREILSPGT